MIIAETKNFVLESHPRPEISRKDGGHLVINPRIPVPDRTNLTVEQVREMAALSHLAGRAMKLGLEDQGIELGRINYQDNGNWRQDLHLHLYGRAVHATYHIYGEPIKSARRPKDKIVQEELSEEDCLAIKNHIYTLSKEAQYERLLV